MPILLRPVCGIEAILVSDLGFHTSSNQDLNDFSETLLCRDMKGREASLVLDSRISSIAQEEIHCSKEVLLHSSMEGCILSDFKVLLLVGICSVLEKQFYQCHVLHIHCVLQSYANACYT